MISGFEIGLAVFILIVTFFALKAGFLSSLLSFIGVFFAAFLADLFTKFATSGIGFMGVKSDNYYFVLFIFFFIVLYFGIELIIGILKKIISVQLLGALDTVLAAIIGVAKAMVIIGVFLTVVGASSFSQRTIDGFKNTYISDVSIEVYRITSPFAEIVIPEVNKAVRGERVDIKKVKKGASKTVRTATDVIRDVIK